MRGRDASEPRRGNPFRHIGDRVIGIFLGILLGIAVILAFLFIGSRSTIDEPSLSGGTTTTQTAPHHPAPKVLK
jgi:hypothetical protein